MPTLTKTNDWAIRVNADDPHPLPHVHVGFRDGSRLAPTATHSWIVLYQRWSTSTMGRCACAWSIWERSTSGKCDAHQSMLCSTPWCVNLRSPPPLLPSAWIPAPRVFAMCLTINFLAHLNTSNTWIFLQLWRPFFRGKITSRFLNNVEYLKNLCRYWNQFSMTINYLLTPLSHFEM